MIVDDNRNIETLRQVAGDFESYLKSQSGLKNISLSSKDSPGQFVFRFQNERLSLAGLTPQDIIGQVYSSINGMKVGTITSEFEDNDIVLKIGEFSDELTPENIENLVVSTKIGNVRVGDFVTYSFEKSLSSIGRENGDITITVDADILPGEVATSYQPKLIAFAQNYNFPDGVSYTAGGEGEENKELVVSTIKSFFIALFLIFGILVLQFNSYSQPMMILYSAILAI